MKRSDNITAKPVIISLILLFMAGILLAAAKYASGFAEWYSVNVYSLITGTIGRLAGIFPFSVAEAAVCILPFVIIVGIVRCRKRLRTVIMHMLLIISVLFFLYTANCGVNYHRNMFVDQKALSGAEFTEEQLTSFCEYIIVPITSAGSRSGVNCILLNLPSIRFDSVLMASVFARPGTPSRSMWPSLSRPISSDSTRCF